MKELIKRLTILKSAIQAQKNYIAYLDECKKNNEWPMSNPDYNAEVCALKQDYAKYDGMCLAMRCLGLDVTTITSAEVKAGLITVSFID